jgi:hypothetical protein
MRDASFYVDRGSSKSISFPVFTNESLATPKNLTGVTLRAFIKEAEGIPAVLEKDLTINNPPSAGIATLSLTPAETRLIPIGRRLQVEVEMYEGPDETTIGRGWVSGFGGINADN